MEPHRWQRVEALYHSALQRPRELRSGYLAAECQGDSELCREVEQLLAHDDEPSGIMDRPLWERAPEMLKTAELPAGALLGPYRIIGPLGSGGMGTVYQAEDTRLGRKVAVKVMRGQANSGELRQRFQREARAISALNHPHICALYDVGSQDGADYLVMECVEGETVAARLRKGALPFAAAMATAAQVADALGAAHARGIVHRDLKPENIMLTAAGAKILDFGLAKTVPRPAVAGRSTVTAPTALTSEGMIVGTLAYMAPEQVEGKECDSRTDIFAFGLVLYEMLAGRRAFPQDTKAGLIAAVIASDPDYGPIEQTSNRQLERVLRGCLMKEPIQRWHSILDVKRLLEWSPEVNGEARTSSRKAPWLPWGLAAASLTLALLMGGLYFRRLDIPAALKYSISLSDSDYATTGPALSPDGLQLAYVVRNEAGIWSLAVHRLDTDSSVVLPETEGATDPFWSVDGRWIGFHAHGRLSKIRPKGGRPQKIADVISFSGAAWSPTGDIVFGKGSRTPLYLVHERGGTPRQITTLDPSRKENSHRDPVFLPGGKQFLFTARSSESENNALYRGSLDPNHTSRIAGMQSNVQVVPARAGGLATILYVRDGALVSQEFDGTRLTSDPVTVVEGVRYTPSSAQAAFAASSDGRVLIYQPFAAAQSVLTWFDRSGTKIKDLALPGNYSQPRISPNGARVAFTQPDTRTGNRDIWTIEVRSGVTARLTINPANDWWPVWSPDGKQILFGSDRQGSVGMRLYLKTALEAGLAETPVAIIPTSMDVSPTDWSKTGWMVYNAYPEQSNTVISGSTSRGDIWVTKASQAKGLPFLERDSNDVGARFSPDGKWIAYTSDETGRSEVFVRPFREGPAGSDDRIQVSKGGGDFPAWGRDRGNLFYISSDLYLKQFHLPPTGTAPGSSATLFKVCAGTALNARVGVGSVWRHPYDVAPDGRFLFNCLVEPPGRFAVWMNWRAAAPP